MWANFVVVNLGIYGVAVTVLEVRTVARVTHSQELMRCWSCLVGGDFAWAFLRAFVQPPLGLNSFELRYPRDAFEVLAIPMMLLYGVGLMWLRRRQLQRAQPVPDSCE